MAGTTTPATELATSRSRVRQRSLAIATALPFPLSLSLAVAVAAVEGEAAIIARWSTYKSDLEQCVCPTAGRIAPPATIPAAACTCLGEGMPVTANANMSASTYDDDDDGELVASSSLGEEEG